MNKKKVSVFHRGRITTTNKIVRHDERLTDIKLEPISSMVVPFERRSEGDRRESNRDTPDRRNTMTCSAPTYMGRRAARQLRVMSRHSNW